MVAAGLGIFATVFWGALTDRVGRRPVYLLGTAAMVLWGIPLFLLINTGAATAIVLAFVVSYAVCQNSLAGVQGAWFPELFARQDPHHRRLPGLPALRRRLRLHPSGRHRALRRLRLDRPGAALRRLRAARPRSPPW